MEELGYAASSSPSLIEKVIDATGGIQAQSEASISYALLIMMRTHSSLKDVPRLPLQGVSATVYGGMDPNELRKLPTWDLETFFTHLHNMVFSFIVGI